MVENIYNLSGRHLTEEEVTYVVKMRCRDIGINIIDVIDRANIRNSKVKFICDNCNEEAVRNTNAILTYKSKECTECANSRKQGRFKRNNLTKESLQEIIDKKYQDREINFIIIDDFIYKNNKQIISVRCSHCGDPSESRIDLLKQGRKSCKCQQIRSKLELKVKNILEKHDLSFEKEYGFDDLRHIQPLRYDFGVKIDNKVFLIECDGIQHFYPTFGKVSFERTMITDKIKDDYAETNNIPLLRIPYNTKESIEEIILKFINS